MFRLLLPIRSEVEQVVHWMPEILFAAEIAFRGLRVRCARHHSQADGKDENQETKQSFPHQPY
jgi:hypothetical protein